MNECSYCGSPFTGGCEGLSFYVCGSFANQCSEACKLIRQLKDELKNREEVIAELEEVIQGASYND